MEYVAFYFSNTHWTEEGYPSTNQSIEDNTAPSFFHLSLPERFFVFYLRVGWFVVVVLF